MIEDIQTISQPIRQRIIKKIEEFKDNLAGDVKRSSKFTPEYRLRDGDYRVLFEINSTTITIYRVKHRSDAYGP